MEALITEISCEAEVAADVVRVVSRLRIELLTKGWHQIPLRLGDAAITSAQIDDRPARILGDGRGGHRLLLENTDTQPREVELTLEYAKAFTKSPGRNSVSFEVPQAPVNRWRVRIPEAGVKVDIHPLIAATEVPVEGAEEAKPDETVVLAFVGAAPHVRIDWTPRADGATGLTALIAADCLQQVHVHEGVVRTHTTITYDISRASIDQLVLEVPTDQKIIGVFDANIRQWSVDTHGDVQRIIADLFEAARGRQNVTVELERFTGDATLTGTDEIVVPLVRVVDAGRQQGALAVAVAEGLRVEVARRSGLMQIDAAEVPRAPSTARAAERWALSYRYAVLPFELALRIERIKPRITMDALVEAVLQPESLTLHVQAVYDIRKAGVFRLKLHIPPGYSVRTDRAVQVPGVTAVKVESITYPETADDRTEVIVNLREQALGRVGFAFDLHKRLDEPDLRKPTGHAADVAIGFPRIASADVEQATGRLIIYAPESLRLNPAAADGLRTLSLSDAISGMQSVVRSSAPSSGKTGSVSGIAAYAFGDAPFTLMLKAERRKPHVTVRQLLAARVETGVVKYTATFYYDIRYSSVESLRLDVPADLAATIQNDTRGVSESAIDPPPADLSDGYVAWNLRGDRAFKGTAIIKLSWETGINALDIGKSATITMPRLMPRDVDRAWGQIVLAKAETIDIRAVENESSLSPVGLRPIDPRHDLMQGVDPATVMDATRAFEFHDDWVLAVTATRYKLEELKRTSIERAFIRTVVTRSDRISTQALYRVRSARQRLAVKLPEGVEFDSDPVRINGRPVPLEHGQKDEYFVPLAGFNPQEPFLLDIRYTVPSGSSWLTGPVFPSEPAVQKEYLGAYLPPEWVFLGSIGPWTDELRWRFDDSLSFKSYPRRYDSELVSWVTQGIGVSTNPGQTFQTDGRFYLFSTLRPLPPPDGALTLVTINEDLLSAIVFMIVAAGGIFLLRYPARIRFLAVGAFLTMLVLLGVFLPTFSRQVIGAVLFLAILTVTLSWLVQYFVWVRPRDPDFIARTEARQEVRMARIRAKLAFASAASVPQPPPPSGSPPLVDKPTDRAGDSADDKRSEPTRHEGGEKNE
ncbi:MAG: hypothetical protein IH987_01255 [Planctomycetes bacterium]|nr:hypothetical protein [Planctomycetota bacterium]